MKLKKSKFKTSFILLLLLVFSVGCQKDKIDKADVRNTNALILFYGEPAVDGCGWIIKIDDNEYLPLELDDSFKTDSMEVVLDFNFLDSYWNCGWREPGYQQIEILKINIKN